MGADSALIWDVDVGRWLDLVTEKGEKWNTNAVLVLRDVSSPCMRWMQTRHWKFILGESKVTLWLHGDSTLPNQ